MKKHVQHLLQTPDSATAAKTEQFLHIKDDRRQCRQTLQSNLLVKHFLGSVEDVFLMSIDCPTLLISQPTILAKRGVRLLQPVSPILIRIEPIEVQNDMSEMVTVAFPWVNFAVKNMNSLADPPDILPVEDLYSFRADCFTDRCNGKARRLCSLVLRYVIHFVVNHDFALNHEKILEDLISDFTWQIDECSHLDASGINRVRLEKVVRSVKVDSRSDFVTKCGQSLAPVM